MFAEILFASFELLIMLSVFRALHAHVCRPEKRYGGAGRFHILLFQAHLKNILTACVARRKPYKLRDNRFKSSFGTDTLSVKEILKER